MQVGFHFGFIPHFTQLRDLTFLFCFVFVFDYEDIMPVVQEQDAEVAAERNIEGKILEKRKRKRKK